MSTPEATETTYTTPNIPIHLYDGLVTAYGNAIESVVLHGTDMPVGAVALRDAVIVGMGYASDRRTGDPTRHAEVEAIFDAGRKRESIDTIITTLEPCKKCQDAIAHIATIQQVAYGQPRQAASDRGLVHAHGESAAERIARLQHPYELIRLDDPSLNLIGESILDSVTRNPDTEVVTVDSKKLLTEMVRLRQLGHTL